MAESLAILQESYRNAEHYFDSISEERFREYYRLPKHLAKYLIEKIRPHWEEKCAWNAITLEVEVLAALYFFASGNYQRGAGAHFLHPISQAGMSRIIKRMSQIISEKLGPAFNIFPNTAARCADVKNKFNANFGLDGCIGCIDGTHIALSGLKREVENQFMNRKGFHSLNVQIICDSDLLITGQNCRFAGSTHDSHVWRSSDLQSHLRERYENEHCSDFLLGDSGYPLQPWLMTPVPHPTTDAEKRYNEKHISARNVVERCIGVLKARFRCINGERKLRYSPENAGRIVVSCMVLHNLMVLGRIEHDGPISLDGPANVHPHLPEDVREVRGHGTIHQAGLRRRQELITQVQ